MENLLLLLGGGAAITTIYSCWNGIKGACTTLSTYVVGRVYLSNDALYAFCCYFNDIYGVQKLGTRKYSGSTLYVRTLDKVYSVIYENSVNTGMKIYWINRWPLIVLPQDKTDGYTKMLGLYYIRGTIDIENVLVKSELHYNNVKTESTDRPRFDVHLITGTNDNAAPIIKTAKLSNDNEENSDNDLTSWNLFHCRFLSYSKSEIGRSPVMTDNLDYMALNHDMKITCNTFDFWINNRQWYIERFIPWKVGFLLHGDPGNGKSAFIRCIARKYDMPIYSYNLSSLTNHEFTYEWSEMLSNTPCIALFEDIDTVYNGRNLVKRGVSFEWFINILDGAQACNGVATFITTNKVDCVDSAISAIGQSSRPGRVDMSIKVDKPDRSGRLKIATRILQDFDQKVIDKIVEESTMDSGAQFQLRCQKLAMEKLYDKSMD